MYPKIIFFDKFPKLQRRNPLFWSRCCEEYGSNWGSNVKLLRTKRTIMARFRLSLKILIHSKMFHFALIPESAGDIPPNTHKNKSSAEKDEPLAKVSIPSYPEGHSRSNWFRATVLALNVQQVVYHFRSRKWLRTFDSTRKTPHKIHGIHSPLYLQRLQIWLICTSV